MSARVAIDVAWVELIKKNWEANRLKRKQGNRYSFMNCCRWNVRASIWTLGISRLLIASWSRSPSQIGRNLVNFASHVVKTQRAAIITIVQDETTHKVEQLLSSWPTTRVFFLLLLFVSSLFSSVFFTSPTFYDLHFHCRCCCLDAIREKTMAAVICQSRPS